MCVEAEEEAVTCCETLPLNVMGRESVVAVMVGRAGVSFERVCVILQLLLHNSLTIMTES